MVTIDEAIERPLWGRRFQCPTGAIGRVLARRSAEGQVLAELTCVVTDCTEVHVRPADDWARCARCNTHEHGDPEPDAFTLAAELAAELGLEDRPSPPPLRVVPGYSAREPGSPKEPTDV